MAGLAVIHELLGLNVGQMYRMLPLSAIVCVMQPALVHMEYPLPSCLSKPAGGVC